MDRSVSGLCHVNVPVLTTVPFAEALDLVETSMIPQLLLPLVSREANSSNIADESGS